jgi:acyl-coenzyme A synthetase/AMP-(fatty) acid ligase
MAELAVNPSAIERATEHQIKVLAGSPSQIGNALKLMKEHNLEIPSLEEVRIAGSSPSEKLISAIHNDLGVSVKSVYGSTEGGGVAFTMLSPGDNTSNLGQIVDGLELEVETSDGPSGRIRYRGPGVSPGYMESAGDDSSFVDGWFYPGDLGHMSETGHLILEGRSDELMNFGGTKLNPEKIEALAKESAGVTDAAVCLVERVPGIEEVAITVVGEKTLDLRKVDQMLRAKLSIGHPTIFTRAQEIPRNRMGKVVREELKKQIVTDLRLN